MRRVLTWTVISHSWLCDPPPFLLQVDAIFGFCDIRQFTDVTECLQEEVMVFVNQIGKIVHSAVHRLDGAANKNIGVCAWRVATVYS